MARAMASRRRTLLQIVRPLATQHGLPLLRPLQPLRLVPLSQDGTLALLPDLRDAPTRVRMSGTRARAARVPVDAAQTVSPPRAADRASRPAPVEAPARRAPIRVVSARRPIASSGAPMRRRASISRSCTSSRNAYDFSNRSRLKWPQSGSKRGSYPCRRLGAITGRSTGTGTSARSSRGACELRFDVVAPRTIVDRSDRCRLS